MKTLLVLTPGDPSGIGPEVTWKAIRKSKLQTKGVSILCVGARKPFDRLGCRVVEVRDSKSFAEIRPSSTTVFLLSAPEKAPAAGVHLEGFQSGWSISTATELVKRGFAAALVTGPISKERLQKGGYPFPGHTEFLAHLCKAKGGVAPDVTMMLANRTLRVSLVTSHISLAHVPKALTRENLNRAILQTVSHLQDWWGIARPHVAIAALNPHAGEAGLFGNEEIKTIVPEIRAIQNSARKGARGFKLTGPLPADTLFANHLSLPVRERYDAVVCMYHDQGLIPVKLVDFPNTVNVTLGLPIVRTSVDHGTGFDIAGRNRADPSSMLSAIDLAIFISKTRAPKRRKTS